MITASLKRLPHEAKQLAFVHSLSEMSLPLSHHRDWHLHFKLNAADTPHNNVKGDTRYFIPADDAVFFDAGSNTLTVRFEYRPMSETEENHFLELYNEQSNKTYKTLSRGRLCKAVEALLMDAIDRPDLKGELTRTEAKTDKSILLTHLNRYTAGKADFSTAGKSET